MIDIEELNSLSLVRLKIGDAEGELISDATIQALLIANSDNVSKTVIDCLKFIVADSAKWTREEVGETQVWWNQQYEHYSKLLSDYLKNPAFLDNFTLHILGGTSKRESNRVRFDPDSRGNSIREGFSQCDYDDRRLI